MLGRFEDLQERKPRQVCHQSFWFNEDRAHALNVSDGGMCIRVASRAEQGEEVTLSHGPELRVHGRVAWTRRLKNCTEVGIQFLDTDSKTKVWLDFANAGSNTPPANGVAQSKLLALPAPGHTAKAAPLPIGWQNGGAGHRPIMKAAVKRGGFRSGQSWQTAVRMIGTQPTDKNEEL